MKKLKNKLKMSPRMIPAAAVCAVLVILCFVMIVAKADGAPEEETAYDYTPTEMRIAEAVREYLAGYITLEEADSRQIADASVQNYRTIITSGVTKVTDEDTEALSLRIRQVLEMVIPSGQVTDTGLDALADGICQIIWDAILEQLKESGTAEEPEYKEEFAYLSNSIQKQIDELKGRNMSINISANIKDKVITAEELESTEENLLSRISNGIMKAKEEVMKEIEDKYGDIKNGSDGKDGINGQNGTAGKDGADGKNGENGRDGKDGADGKNGENGRDGRDGEDGKDGISGRDGKDGINGRDGINGKDGADGINGKDGKDGKDGISGKDGIDGVDGKDGESVYLMFSEYPDGRNESGEVSMSPVQSNTTKYMGTAHAAGDGAPTEPEAYTWSEYKDYIMYTELDENGVPTLYIR